MAWLKYQLSYAHGLGQPEYVEFKGDPQDMMDEINCEHGDGIRYPHFVVLERLPPEILQEKIRDAIGNAQGYLRLVDSYLRQLDHHG